MSKRKYRKIVPKGVYYKQIKEPTPEEKNIILMAADSIIPFSGGRNYLVKLLRGSKSQIMIQNKAEESEYYGKLSNLTLNEIQRKVDWLIVNGWLALKQEWKTPFIVHTLKGWELVKYLWVDKLLDMMDKNPGLFLRKIRNINPEIKWFLLDVIEDGSLTIFKPVLTKWRGFDAEALGASQNGYPTPKTYSFGIEFGF